MFASSKDSTTKTAKDGMLNEGGHALDDLKASARHLNSDAHDAAAAVKEDVLDAARRTGQHARDMADSASHSMSDVVQTMTHKIRENPIQSSVIALGVGLFAGMIFSRR